LNTNKLDQHGNLCSLTKRIYQIYFDCLVYGILWNCQLGNCITTRIKSEKCFTNYNRYVYCCIIGITRLRYYKFPQRPIIIWALVLNLGLESRIKKWRLKRLTYNYWGCFLNGQIELTEWLDVGELIQALNYYYGIVTDIKRILS